MRNQIVRMYEVYKASAHPNRWVPKTLEKFFFILLEFSLSSSSLAILVLITLFAISRYLSPNPPAPLGLQTISQSTSAHFGFISKLCHRKFL